MYLNHKKPYREQLKPDGFYFSLWFICFMIGGFIWLILTNSDVDQEIKPICTSIALTIIFIGILVSQIKTSILIHNQDLILIKSFFGKHFTQGYHLERIKNVRYQKNVRSGFSVSPGEIKVMGMNATPESWKDYYYHTEIVSFDYEGKKITIGKYKRKFNGERLYRILKHEMN